MPVMPRPRYRQDPLPLGDCGPPPTLYGPEQPLPAGLERIEQGQLGVVPLGPLFDTMQPGDTDPRNRVVICQYNYTSISHSWMHFSDRFYQC
jgi:hypothetical protein